MEELQHFIICLKLDLKTERGLIGKLLSTFRGKKRARILCGLLPEKCHEMFPNFKYVSYFEMKILETRISKTFLTIFWT